MTQLSTIWQQLRPQLARHWFKIGLISLLLYAFFSKDLSLNLRLHSPTTPPTETNEPAQPTLTPPKRPARRHTLTDAAQASTVTDKLNFSWFPTGKKGQAPKTLVQRIAAMPEQSVLNFVQRFVHVAEAEQQKFGIPASIILANGLLHSLAGERPSASEGFNFFVLPCTPDWAGATGQYDGLCLRHYDNAWLSFRDHSLYLSSGQLAKLSQLDPRDYRAWAKGLEAANFAGTPDLSQQLLSLIERYQLFQYDR